ncbi:MAG: HAD hydrolase-like protein [Gammaproteobacteria bacterium]|nr:HAD hydrolase-like protein [Gammaproteobacteria bacterium]
MNVTDRSRVICVGDSIEHDIAGGASAGLSTALVRTGILDDLTDENRQAEYARYAVCPDYILPAFI